MAIPYIAERKEVELRGYFMRHKKGGDVGFSWNKDDPKFSEDWERIAAVPESATPSPSTAPTEQDAASAVLSAVHDGIPLQEPVNITKAVLAQREARVSLSGGTGPVACAMLVNIQLTPWVDGPEKAEAFASGYNTAMKWYRAALLDLAEKVGADAASRGRAQGGVTNSNSPEFAGIKQSSTAPTVEVDERAAATILKSIIEDGYLSETNVARYHAALASKPPAREVAERQSIESDPRFVELLDEFAYRASERRAMGGDFGSAEAEEVAEAALIAHIDTWGAGPDSPLSIKEQDERAIRPHTQP